MKQHIIAFFACCSFAYPVWTEENGHIEANVVNNVASIEMLADGTVIVKDSGDMWKRPNDFIRWNNFGELLTYDNTGCLDCLCGENFGRKEMMQSYHQNKVIYFVLRMKMLKD